MRHHFNLILIGPQGSGKGTQADILKHRYHMHAIAGGDIARSLAKQSSTLGETVRTLMNEGKLLPDRIVNQGAEQVLHKHPSQNYLFDGYPRTLEQAAFVEPLLRNLPHPFFVILLDLDDKTSVERIKHRFTCERCGSVIYSRTTDHTTILHKLRALSRRCHHCGGHLVQRSDDTEDAVRERLKLYHKETKPVIEFFKDKHALYTVDARPPIPKVTDLIEETIEKATRERT